MNEEMKQTVEALWAIKERIVELDKEVSTRERDDPLREAAHLERQTLYEQSAQWVYALHDLEKEHWPMVTEAYTVDLGVASLIAQTLVEVRSRMQKELERDDLTPYMWLMIHNRMEHINGVLGIIGGKRSRKNPIENVPTIVVYAEYEDGSIDVQEANSTEEADEIEKGWLDEGAVVWRYSVLPELGTPATLYEPVTPFENRHRTLTTHKYQRLVRLKGGEKFDLPDEIRPFVLVDDNQYFRSVDNLDDD